MCIGVVTMSVHLKLASIAMRDDRSQRSKRDRRQSWTTRNNLNVHIWLLLLLKICRGNWTSLFYFYSRRQGLKDKLNIYM